MANGTVKLSAVCVGVRGRKERTSLGRYSCRCPLLLKRSGGSPTWGDLVRGCQEGVPGPPDQKKVERTRPRQGRGRVLCPTSAKVRGARDSAAAIRGQHLGGGGGGGGRRGKTAAGGGRQRRGHCYSGTKTRSAGTPGAAERTRLPRRHVGSGQLPAGPAPARRGAGPEERMLGAGAGVRIAGEYSVARPERLRSDRPRRLPFPFPILIKVVKVKANKRRRKVN